MVAESKFEVGFCYYPDDYGYDPIKVVKRTEKTVWVDNGHASWYMRVKHDGKGNEVLIDSSVGRKWCFAFVYRANCKVKGEP